MNGLPASRGCFLGDLRIRGTRSDGKRASLTLRRVPDGGLEVTHGGTVTRFEPGQVSELVRWIEAIFPRAKGPLR